MYMLKQVTEEIDRNVRPWVARESNGSAGSRLQTGRLEESSTRQVGAKS